MLADVHQSSYVMLLSFRIWALRTELEYQHIAKPFNVIVLKVVKFCWDSNPKCRTYFRLPLSVHGTRFSQFAAQNLTTQR